MRGDIYVTGSSDADELLNTDPAALLIGMLLDQQVPLEWAFTGPHRLRSRLGYLEPRRIAELPLAELTAAACERPAIHRYPAAMATRIQQLCSAIVVRHGGDAGSIWQDDVTGAELLARLRSLPGFGDEKSMITIAVLAKRFGVRPDGWEQAAGAFADHLPRTVADAHDAESLAQVRAWKLAQRQAGLDKQGRPATTR